MKSDTILRLIVRAKESHQSLKVMVEDEHSIEDLNQIIRNYLDIQSDDYRLFYRGRKLSSEKCIKDYNISDNNVLVFTNSENSISSSNIVNNLTYEIPIAKQWLLDNIVKDETNLKLISYKRKKAETWIEFENEEMKYRINVTDNRVKEYDVFK
ncbi:MAG: ubiquitin-like domain-containing protein [Thermoplasmata archaeon]